ncbi:MAG: hypothetical protein IT179_17700 [Acidobacteria bacterium]|nr:hypothetical protein [Acidobacteriota bacterium]
MTVGEWPGHGCHRILRRSVVAFTRRAESSTASISTARTTCSPTVNPQKHPLTAQLYTKEQIAIPHVKLIVDHLVKPHPNHREVTANRLYQKVA